MEKANPLLSVIMPAFNAASYIEEAIESILQQTFMDFELIIADDGSVDKTVEIVNKYKDPRIITSHNAVNQGKTQTVNRLVKEARGQFITVHDADDVSHNERFQRQIDLFQKDQDLILCGTSFYTVDSKGFILEKNEMPATYEEVLTGIDKHSQFHGPTMMIRKSILEGTEFYRPYFMDNYEDTDLAYRVSEKGKSLNLKDPLYVYRILETSLCRKDVNVRSRNLYSLVSFLGNQRRQTGMDALMEGKPEQADDFMRKTTIKYQSDPSLIYREAAAYYFYWKLNKKALQAAKRGIVIRPFHLNNLRTYLYILRNLILNYFDKRNKVHYKKMFG